MQDTNPQDITDDDAPIWGAGKIAEVINLTRDQTYHLLSKEPPVLPATKVGAQWVSTKRALRRALGLA